MGVYAMGVKRVRRHSRSKYKGARFAKRKGTAFLRGPVGLRATRSWLSGMMFTYVGRNRRWGHRTNAFCRPTMTYPFSLWENEGRYVCGRCKGSGIEPAPTMGWQPEPCITCDGYGDMRLVQV